MFMKKHSCLSRFSNVKLSRLDMLEQYLADISNHLITIILKEIVLVEAQLSFLSLLLQFLLSYLVYILLLQLHIGFLILLFLLCLLRINWVDIFGLLLLHKEILPVEESLSS